MDEQKVKELIRQELATLFKTDRLTFEKNVQILDGRNVQVGKTTGTKFGTEGGASGQKLGFWSATPVVQQPTITAPTGGGSGSTDAIDITGRAAINEIKALLTTTGLSR